MAEGSSHTCSAFGTSHSWQDHTRSKLLGSVLKQWPFCCFYSHCFIIFIAAVLSIDLNPGSCWISQEKRGRWPCGRQPARSRRAERRRRAKEQREKKSNVTAAAPGPMRRWIVHSHFVRELVERVVNLSGLLLECCPKLLGASLFIVLWVGLCHGVSVQTCANLQTMLFTIIKDDFGACHLGRSCYTTLWATECHWFVLICSSSSLLLRCLLIANTVLFKGNQISQKRISCETSSKTPSATPPPAPLAMPF